MINMTYSEFFVCSIIDRSNMTFICAMQFGKLSCIGNYIRIIFFFATRTVLEYLKPSVICESEKGV